MVFLSKMMGSFNLVILTMFGKSLKNKFEKLYNITSTHEPRTTLKFRSSILWFSRVKKRDRLSVWFLELVQMSLSLESFNAMYQCLFFLNKAIIQKST